MLPLLVNAIVSPLHCVHLYVSLHHILLDSCLVTCDRWCVLVLLRTMCSTSLSHQTTVGKHHALHHVGQYLSPTTTSASEHRATTGHIE
jgi:hypothetical protein